jgi:hypothetical protein
MVTKELFELMIHGTAGENTGRLKRLRTAISTAGKTTLYSEPVTVENAAWVLLTYFFCPSSSIDKVVDWIDEKGKEWSAMPDKHNPIKKFAALLENLEKLPKIQSAIVDSTWGFIRVELEGMPPENIATQNIPDDYQKISPIRESFLVSGDFLRLMAVAINLHLFPELSEKVKKHEPVTEL